MIWVMSDIHGDYEHYMEMLEKIELGDDDKLYILGDILDRGEGGFELLFDIMERDNVFLIKGNHELFYEMFYEHKLSSKTWIQYGGVFSVSSLAELSDEQKEKAYEYIKGLPHYIELDIEGTSWFLTHAGPMAYPLVMEDNVIRLKETIEQQVKLNEFNALCHIELHIGNLPYPFDKRLVVGHFPTINYCYDVPTIIEKNGFIDIDTGNGYRARKGKLTCMCLDDGRVYTI